MDPLTQGVIGGLIAQTRAPKELIAKAILLGGLAGMAPDLDVLIRSGNDPLLALEFHRHFTHSLFFIPFGGLICAAFFYLLIAKRWRLTFRQILIWCTLGYATHGLLDAFTSYGTQLLWPFSNLRVAWDTISVIDPLFTLPILIGLIAAARTQSHKFASAAILWGTLYLSFGLIQHERALDLGEEIALSRGHLPERLEAKPSFANLLVWKVVYKANDHFYVDAVRPGFGKNKHWPGDNIPILDLERDFPWLDPTSQQARDIERFRWFSAGYIAADKTSPNSIIDIRYSMLPQEIKPLWGIRVIPTEDINLPATYYTEREDSQTALSKLLDML